MTGKLDLPIEGMTCAGCATRVERSLNELDGVQATVNFATERAAVEFDDAAVEPEQLLAAVEAAGIPLSIEIATESRAARDRAAAEVETPGLTFQRGERVGSGRARRRHRRSSR